MSALFALLLVQPMVRIGPPEPLLPPSDPAAAFATFRSLCADPFPDAAAFDRAVAARPDLVRWKPATPVEEIVPGRTWTSTTLRLRYFAADGSSLPRPQCLVDAAVPTGTPPESLFALFATTLGLTGGKIVGKAAFRTAMWDVEQGGGVRWRTILGTERDGPRLKLKLARMRLPPKS